MTTKILVWIAIGLIVIIAALGVSLKLSMSKSERLQAEKNMVQQQLDLTKADLKVSIDNHNRIVSEKNRLLASERDRAAAEQSAAVDSARIAKDIDYAEDGTKCRDSDPMQRVLRGLHNAERHGGSSGLDPVPATGRSTDTAGVPKATSGN